MSRGSFLLSRGKELKRQRHDPLYKSLNGLTSAKRA